MSDSPTPEPLVPEAEPGAELDPYAERGAVEAAEVGMPVAWFPHSNGSHPQWTGSPYRGVVVEVGGARGVVVALEGDTEDRPDVHWGHPHPVSRRVDVSFAVPWQDRFEVQRYDDDIADSQPTE